MKRRSILLAVSLLIAGAASAQGVFGDMTYLLNRIQTARAVAWGDVNNDGWPDLVVGGENNSDTRLFINNHEPTTSFTDATAQYDLPPMVNVRRLQWLDVDGDGLLDLFVLMNNGTQIRLFRQIANHQFQTVPLNIGRQFTDPVISAAWVDMDNDGDLDLVLSSGASYREAPIVLRQRSNRNFVQLRDNPFESGVNAVGALAFCDYDRNGQLDVFTGFGATEEPAHIYRNMIGHYDDWTEKCGLAPKIGQTGAVWFDYDGDQWPDLFVPGTGKPEIQLYRNVRAGTERMLQAVTMPGDLTAGADGGIWADAVDANMDGYLDLFIIKGYGQGCSLMMNGEGCEWKDKAGDVGISFGRNTVLSAAWADYDGDGAPDLAMVLQNGGIRLLRNGTLPAHAFVRVNLFGTLGNTPVTNVTATMIFENFKQMATVAPTASGMSSDGTTLLFADRADGSQTVGELLVNWPNGITQSYPIADLAWYGTTNLHMPTPTAPPIVETPETPVAGDMSISPNPFNPTTNLSFTLTNTANVSLAVYDMLGRQVADLAHGALGAGEHRLTFDAGTLPSGMYFSRLTVNGVPNVKRMMLAK